MKSLRCLTLLLLVPFARAEEALSADAIILKAEQAAYYAGKDGRADVNMTITDASGGSRSRDFRILRWNGEGGAQKFYVYFTSPADVRQMAYLVWKPGGGRDDDRWLWLPNIGKVNRIAPGDKRTSFVGSDFVYEDVSGRSPADDHHTLLETTESHYVIRNVPVNPASVDFAHYDVWIDKESFLPWKAEYTDAAGKIFRRVRADQVEVIQGYPTVLVSTVEDLRTGGKTVNTFRDVRYDIGLDERIFSERFLRRPPREAVQ